MPAPDEHAPSGFTGSLRKRARPWSVDPAGQKGGGGGCAFYRDRGLMGVAGIFTNRPQKAPSSHNLHITSLPETVAGATSRTAAPECGVFGMRKAFREQML